MQNLLTLTPNTREKLASATIKEKLHENESTTSTSLKQQHGKSLTVEQGCAERRLGFQEISHDTMMRFKTSLNLSNRQTLEAAKILRHGAQKNTVVEKNFKQALSNQGQALQSFFRSKKLTFSHQPDTSGEAAKVQEDCVLCTDIAALVAYLTEARNLCNTEEKLIIKSA